MNYNRDQKGRFTSKSIVNVNVESSIKRFTTEKETSKPFERSRAFFEIERAGQQVINESDEVKVELTIYIPAVDFRIKDELRFSNRCEIMDHPLYYDWGLESIINSDFRVRIKSFFGTKWVDVFEEARKYATSEINKLEKMLENRENALKNAEY